ncbi:RNA-binding protein [Ktedonobacteria bacterium brp13]|nr:RNA-binding protein [Ktedonobacteria bacterium brp13]
MRLYVGGLPYRTNEDELAGLFEQAGTVNSATVITDRETGRSKGFGFVDMSSDEEGQRAIELLNGTTLGNRTIVVNEARERQNGGGGGGGYQRRDSRDSYRSERY